MCGCSKNECEQHARFNSSKDRHLTVGVVEVRLGDNQRGSGTSEDRHHSVGEVKVSVAAQCG